MAPRHDRTPSLTGNNTSATRLRYSGSSTTTCYNESLRQLDILSRNYTSVREDSKKKKTSQSAKHKKVSFNLKNALRSGQ
ncbi:10305_t:CDS:1, partial [Paraglomus occultum]